MTDPNVPNPYQQQPGQPGGYPYQQPKKSHTARNILIGLGLAGVLACGGCLAVVGLGANEVDKAMDEEAKNDKPTDIKVGKAFEHDGYSVAAGWTAKVEEFGGLNIQNMKVTVDEADEDLPDAGRSALLTFRFYKGTEVLAEVTCSSNEMQVGETSRMDCYGDDSDGKGYDTVKVADAF